MKITASLVTDDSGSMDGKKLQDAKQAQLDFSEKLPDDSLVGLVSFGGRRARLLQKPTDDTSRVRSSLNRLRAEGKTPLYSGLKLGYRQVKDLEGKKVMVICTDGRANVGPTGNEIVKLGEKIKREGTKLVTVAIGGDADRDLLKKLASIPDDFHQAEFSGQLPDLYKDIVAGITPVGRNEEG